MTVHRSIYAYLALCISITSTPSVADFIPQTIATGSFHTCVLSTEGAIKCWGYNGFGGLGTGDNLLRGRDPETMGKNLPLVDLGLNSANKVVDVCAGSYSTCALTQDGRVKCWGDNNAGQLGQGLAASQNKTMGSALPFTDLGTNFKVKALACGNNHTCALSDKGLVKCWGDNSMGALGLGDKVSRGRRPEDMGDKLPTLKDLTNIQAITAGDRSTCALSEEGARCWGQGAYGQLGLESVTARGSTPDTIPSKSPVINLTANAGETILSLAAGNIQTCALMTAAASKPFVKCWGYNIYG